MGFLKNLVAPKSVDSLGLEDIVKRLKAHYAPKKLLISERYKFYKRDQLSGESVSNYVIELKRLASQCNFNTFLEEALRDRLVCGLTNEAIQRKLLTESDLTFTRAVEVAVSMELASRELKGFHESSSELAASEGWENAGCTDSVAELAASEGWEDAGCTDSVAGLSHTSAPHCVVTVVLGRSTPRYRLQADNAAALCLVLSQLTARVEGYYAARNKTVSISFPAGSLPIAPLMAAIDNHVELRNSIKTLRVTLANQTTQYRAIERRLLSKLRERTVQPLVGLDKLLSDTHHLIVTTSHAIEDNTQTLETSSCELACIVRLVLVLVRMCDTTNLKDWTDLAAAMSYVMHSSETQGWEEVCEPGVSYLLSTSLAKSVRDHQRSTIDPLKDSARFKKLISMALDRVVSGLTPRPREDARAVSPIMEGEENISSAHVHSRKNSSDDNLVSLKLLPSRKALQSYDKPRKTNEEDGGEDLEDLV
ncbi:uncharacterized protein LOC129004967 [Macrosteles quadrilineatus]|uniref:uncharacterized protein LOC129004967 n=1 Tax=Macrosteles quadrilineatus TaxID=74068 RepID=UPI0023E18CE2|nr:uncharacterized protein LOC129004967 [Macrosteles quadrilineatus]